MGAITIVGRITTNHQGFPCKEIKIFGADSTLVTSFAQAFPSLQTPKDIVAEGVWSKSLQRRQPTPVILYTYYVYKNLSKNSMKEKEDNILAEVTCYLSFLTEKNFSIVSVSKEPPVEANENQLTYTWTLQRKQTQSLIRP